MPYIYSLPSFHFHFTSSAMTLDSCRARRLPSPETRQGSCSASRSSDSQLKGQASKLAKDARRRRVELRRIRSFNQALSAADPPASAPDGVENLIKMQKEGDFGAESGRRSHGQISVVGRRREMGDAVAVKLGFLKRGRESYDFFGVFDGRKGRRAVRASSQMLHRVLAVIVEEESKKEIIDWEVVMMEGFHEVEAKMNENGAAAALIGSVAIVGDNDVVVAGTKAVLSRGGAAVRLLDGGKSKGGEREVRVRVERRSRADKFLILGSDGFWNFMPDEVACQIGRKYCSGGGGVDDFSGGAEAAAALMAEMAVAHGSKDNVSVILVDLRSADAETVSNGV